MNGFKCGCTYEFEHREYEACCPSCGTLCEPMYCPPTWEDLLEEEIEWSLNAGEDISLKHYNKIVAEILITSIQGRVKHKTKIARILGCNRATVKKYMGSTDKGCVIRNKEKL